MERPVIRHAESADVAQIIGGYRWLFEPPGGEPPGWDPERAGAVLGRSISSGSVAVLVATIGDEVVGLCTAYEDLESVRFGRRVWVEDLAVHPDHRSAGIGKQLLDAAKAWAKQRGVNRLELESSVLRTDAHRFYERQQPDWRALSFGWWT